MPPSQLKRLKTSLREKGIIGPQQSKKLKKKTARDAKTKKQRLSRAAALENIREQLNPFEFTHSRGPKFPVTTNRPDSKGIKGRPGVSKATAEEKRRQTILPEIQGRNKVGSIVDRRFGEEDPTMTPEERARERWALEAQKGHKKTSLFDLEDESAYELTHGGKSLTLHSNGLVDDFHEDDLGSDSGDEKRSEDGTANTINWDGERGHSVSEKPKTKQEVMNELIAKSKFHKHERQVAKDANDELRAEVDDELINIAPFLFGSKVGKEAADLTHHPDEATPMMAGVNKAAMNKEFDVQVKRLAMDQRAQPAARTKTEEEIAEEQQAKLKELEEKRQARMRGEQEHDSDEDLEEEESKDVDADPMATMFVEEEEDFGLGKGIKTRPTATELGLNDEDDFLIEDDLVASGSDIEPDEDVDLESSEGEADDYVEDDEFTKGLLNAEEERNPEFEDNAAMRMKDSGKGDDDGIPYTFPCPQSYAELIHVISPYPREKLPTIIQRVRALHHPGLDSKNKERLGNFSRALIDFISTPLERPGATSFAVLESVIRHIHSLAKTCPVDIAKQCRVHLTEMSEARPTSLHTGDLVLLTAVGSIFPTSDHFHQVVTPAVLCMGRYLGQKVPRSLADYATGTYLGILALQYQQLSKRYVPELMNFSLNTLCALSPRPSATKLGGFPVHAPVEGRRIRGAQKTEIRKLSFEDCTDGEVSPQASTSRKIALINTTIGVLEAAVDTWSGKPCFYETFHPLSRILKHLTTKACRSELPPALNDRIDKAASKAGRTLKVAELSRRTLELHHHRPLAIKTYDPRWEDNFDPNKHYDPDRDRAEMAKLKAEVKREKKGALSELRKDSRFMAREKLKMQKAKDDAYEQKMRKTIAEIQNEEGKAANEYERESKARKRAKTRR